MGEMMSTQQSPFDIDPECVPKTLGNRSPFIKQYCSYIVLEVACGPQNASF